MFMGGMLLCVSARLTSTVLFDASYRSAWIFIPILSTATVFTALNTFMGSAYYAAKKTSMSMWTSLIGAALNIVLNLIVIPRFGAMGASVATFASYFVVFIIRAVTMKRFIPFKMYPVKVTVNTALILGVTALMTLWGDTVYGLLLSVGVTLAGVVYNGKDIFLGCKYALRAIKSKKA